MLAAKRSLEARGATINAVWLSGSAGPSYSWSGPLAQETNPADRTSAETE